MTVTRQDQVQLENFLRKKPSINTDQAEVLDALAKHGPATGEQIARKLGRQYHRISGRFGELQDKDLVEVKGYERNENGYKCKIWKVKH